MANELQAEWELQPWQMGLSESGADQDRGGRENCVRILRDFRLGAPLRFEETSEGTTGGDARSRGCVIAWLKCGSHAGV